MRGTAASRRGVVSLGAGEEVGTGAFRPAALPHHDDAVGHFGHHAHVMGDQDDRGAQVALQVAQQVQHLALHGHVERGGRLVGDQHFGAQRQRHGDHHPLAHAAGKFMRDTGHPPFGLRQAHRAQRRERARARLGRG
jgi:hypothetical protein